MVELVYVEGDIGRMNTVFKFYLQAWTFMAVSAAAALCWLIPLAKNWKSPLRITWQCSVYDLADRVLHFIRFWEVWQKSKTGW